MIPDSFNFLNGSGKQRSLIIFGPKVDNTLSLQSLLRSKWWTAWEEADLRPCLRYVCGMHRLNVPGDWLEFHAEARKKDPWFV